MPIVQQGSINTTALVVPDLYVQIVPLHNTRPRTFGWIGRRQNTC